MDDPKTVRLNDADNPNRRARFEDATKRFAVSGNEAIRRLVDAWLLYVGEHGRPPEFPVRLAPLKRSK